MGLVKGLFVAAALTGTSLAAHATETNELTAADQCMIDAYGEIISRHAQTTDVHEVEIAPLQERCEEDTGSVVQHPGLLKKGLSNWSAGGTRFLFK